MQSLDASVCWAVLVPLPVEEIERIAIREWAREAPHAIDPPPWRAEAGEEGWNALVSRLPGSEGADRHFARLFSGLLPGQAIHAVWLDPGRRQAFAWKDGREADPPLLSPEVVAEQAGFAVAGPGTPVGLDMSAAIVEGASLADVRAALGEFADEPWLRVEEGPAGVVIAARDGPLGTQAWDVAEALPSASVYVVQKSAMAFEVLVLKGVEQLGLYRVPPFDGEPGVLADIKGETDPVDIMRVLGIPA
jgi:hypothetical protein